MLLLCHPPSKYLTTSSPPAHPISPTHETLLDSLHGSFQASIKRHTFLASSMDRAHMERAKGVETILSHALTAANTSDLSFYKRRPPTQLVLGFFPATQYSIALSLAYDIPFWNLFLTFLYIYSSYLPLTTAMRPRLREADILSPPTHYSRLRFLLSSQISIPLL